MDYIDYCHRILDALNKENHNSLLTPLGTAKKLYGKDFDKIRGEFWSSVQGRALLHALKDLQYLKLYSQRNAFIDITREGQRLLNNPHSYWENICRIELDEDTAGMLNFVNEHSQKSHYEPFCVETSMIERNPIMAHYNLPMPANWSELGENYQRVLNHTPYILNKLEFIRLHGGLNDCVSRGLSATYQGIVWGTRRGETIETQFLDRLIDDWETPTVEFKQELHLSGKPERAELAKDILALANTRASGRRYLIVGFKDKNRRYHAPPSSGISTERIAQILLEYAAPQPRVRYDEVDYRDGKVGKLEIIREKKDLPYRAVQTVESQPKHKTHLKKGVVYFRSNNGIAEAEDAEIARLLEEAKIARLSD